MKLIDTTYSTSPYFNLAMEEYFLKQEEEFVLLWQNDKSVIVGRNQNTLAEIDAEYVKQKGIVVARRMSGGGAVFHDLGNLNYTFLSNREGEDFGDYARFTKPIVDMMQQKLGLHASLSGRNDLLLDGKKFSGNAQYVWKNRILHHGTLLFSSVMEDLSSALRVDEEKIKSKGIASVRSRVTNISAYTSCSLTEYRELLAQAMMEAGAEPYQLTKADIAEIDRLREEKYATWEWNYGYSPAYTFHKKAYGKAGLIEVFLDVKDGEIVHAKIYGDFFAKRDIGELEQQLVGLLHHPDTIAKLFSRIPCADYFAGIDKESLLPLFY